MFIAFLMILQFYHDNFLVEDCLWWAFNYHVTFITAVMIGCVSVLQWYKRDINTSIDW